MLNTYNNDDKYNLKPFKVFKILWVGTYFIYKEKKINFTLS